MSEGYKVIYSIEQNIYTKDSPVIIRRGGLVRDIKHGNMFCQFILLNIIEKTIKAVSYKVVTDIGTLTGTQDGFICTRDMELTLNIPLEGYDHTTTELQITDVEFTDSSRWRYDASATPQKLLYAPLLEEYYHDKEFVKEFKYRYEEAKYYPTEELDLWHCCCGAINRSDEAACHSCSRTLSTLKKYAEEELPKAVARQKRIDAIHKKNFDEAYKNVIIDKKAKRNHWLFYMILFVIIITVVALLIAADGTHYTQAI